MSIIGRFHDQFVFARRTRVLATRLSEMIPSGSRVLDVGCGDGSIDRMIMRSASVSIEGIETLIRPKVHIPVSAFNGLEIPYSNRSYDIVMFVDVLHHCADPKKLLAEAARVGRQVLIKDHLKQGWLADGTLRLMDWVGNARHGITLPYDYWSNLEWQSAFQSAGLQVLRTDSKLNLYPAPFSWIFDRDLHFISLLRSQ